MNLAERNDAMSEEHEEQIRQRTQILTGLHSGIITVVFTKVDGTERTMKCTLNREYLPEQTDIQEHETKSKTKPDTSIAVWDVEKEAWRSFRWDSIKGYQT